MTKMPTVPGSAWDGLATLAAALSPWQPPGAAPDDTG